MILVLVGTNPYSLSRLVSEIDRLAEKRRWKVFVQLGHTQPPPDHCEFVDFLPRPELLERISHAEIVVSHGGFGSMRDALAAGKPVVAVPRDPLRRESRDNQEDLVRALAKRNRVIGVYEIGDLESAILRARDFVPAPGVPTRIPDLIRAYLDHF